jgi:PAS domain S-box-containing protein
MDQQIGQMESDLDRAIRIREGRNEGTVVPIGGPLRSQETLRERERWFRQVLSGLPAAVYTTDANGRLTYFNEAAAELWGQRPLVGSSEWCGSWKLYWPDGRPMTHDQCPMAIALREDRAVRGMEATCERPDGTRVPFIPYPTPLHDEAGRLVGAVNMLVDITERKRAEERQHLMVRELHHRVKNTLATVQAIMGSTARSATSIAGFQNALIGRISALAKTHVLLSDENPVSFADILHSELDAFDDGSDDRIHLSGPNVEIPPQYAVTLGMAAHELATNAVKYGALSMFGGKVDVTWSETIEADRRRLDFEWVESGGPKVTKPKRKGFGVRMLEFVLPGQIQATTAVDYKPKGVRVRCSVPMPAKRTQ